MSRFDLNHLPQDHEPAPFVFHAYRPWAPAAECRTYPTWLFFDDSDVADDECKLVCARCTVRAKCLEQALTEEKGLPAEERYGVRGGMTSHERATLRPTTKP